MSKWSYEDTAPVGLCKGVEIDSSVYEISENRYYTLILKGIIVYLITAGGLGAYLTALDIDFNQIVFNLVILVTAIICAMLYHSWKSENLGYLVFFIIYATVMFLFKDYINSGFYAVINETLDWASIYFDTEGLQTYNERISNRYVAVTVAVSIIGVAENVLLNNYILRRARYIVAIGLALTLNVTAFYMELEPDTIYSIMVLLGIFMTFVLKCGRHFYLSRRDHIFGKVKKGLSYNLDFRSLWQGMLIVGIYVLVVIAGMSTIYDKTYYDAAQEKSEDKEASNDMFQNFIMLGFFGIINYYPNNGGLSTGELGGVSSITLDYMTDLTVMYTPYTTEMLYIKNFTGGEYEPYENKWLSIDQKSEFKNTYPTEVSTLKEYYESGGENSARGYLTITNVEAPALAYQPYYSDSDIKPIFLNQTKTYTFYPRLTGNTSTVETSESKKMYLDVPRENRKAVDEFIKEAGIQKGTAREVATQIKNYYQDNVPYTIRPGATPWRQDFINYFLQDNKKGYCAHFASAATLILRRMGIPARYCEGYAISLNQVNDNGELVENEKYSDHYDGYNELGETALIRVDATDADAHAWVEIYDETEGWIKFEVTPSGGLLDEEDDEDSFWDNFNNIFGDGDENVGEAEGEGGDGLTISRADTIMRYVAYVVIGLVALAILIFVFLKIYPTIKYNVNYSRAGHSDKLIMKYSRLLAKKRKKD
ncbi:MAG: transglutaminase domain-containing protein, partial [Eubacterium sp.]|nr:transglutaminase domain-containing protein [Eubacterium sp.]